MNANIFILFNSSRFRSVRHGMRRAIPIVMGYVPIGFAYGVLAQQAGLSALNTLLMSLIVYAGSAQFIAVSMFAAGIPALAIIVTTFIVNLRHMLFSAAVSPYLKGWKKWQLAIFAYELTDESFAVHIAGFPERIPPKAETLVINMTAQVSWICGSWLGIVAGQLLTDTASLALDYTLIAMFIALLVMQIKVKREILIAVFSGVLSVALTLLGMDRWSVILATVVAATLGVLLEYKKPKTGLRTED